MAEYEAVAGMVCTDNDAMKCRFYENIFPEPDEFIIVKTTHIGEMGSHVELLEFTNVEGIIFQTEIGRRRMRSTHTLFKVGRMEVVRVIRVDKEKGSIDLSRRYIKPEDREKCVERYNKALAVRNMLSCVAKKNNIRLEDLCTQVGWPQYDALRNFLESTASAETTDIFAGLDVSSELKEELLQQMVHLERNPGSIALTAEVSSDGKEKNIVFEIPQDGSGDATKSRYYEKNYPMSDELVIVQITALGETGAYCALLEYNNVEGLVIVPEVLGSARSRFKHLRCKVGRLEIVRVLRVDEERGYIDLTKRNVDPMEAKICEEKFRKASFVHSVLSHVAKLNDVRLEDLCAKVGWPLYAKFGHAFDAFTMALNAKNEASADSDIFVGLDVSPELQHKLLERFSRRLISHPVKPIAKTDEASVRDVKEAQRSDVIVEGAAPVKATVAPGLQI